MELPQHFSHRFMIFDWLPPWASLCYDNTAPPQDLPGKMIANGATADGGSPKEGKLPPHADVDHEEDDDVEEEEDPEYDDGVAELLVTLEEQDVDRDGTLGLSGISVVVDLLILWFPHLLHLSDDDDG